MKNTLKSIMSLVIVLAIILSMTACGGSSTKKESASENKNTEANESKSTEENTEEDAMDDTMYDVTISYMVPQTQFGYYGDNWEKIADIIKTKTGVTIDVQSIPDNQFAQLIKTKSASDEMPDMWQENANPGVIPAEGASFGIQGIDEHMADLSDEPWVARLADKEWKNPLNGEYNALPLASVGMIVGVVYNKETFESAGITEVPTTWTGFLGACEKLKASGVNPLYMSDKDLWTTQIYLNHYFYPALAGKGVRRQMHDDLSTNTKKIVDYPEIFEKGLTMFKELYSKGYTNSESVTATYDSAFEEIATGSSAMMTNGSWVFAEFGKKFPGSVEKLGLFALPVSDTEEPLLSSDKGGMSLYANKNSENLDAVKAVLNAFSQPEVMSLVYEANPQFSSFVDVPTMSLAPALVEADKKYISVGKTMVNLVYGPQTNNEEINKIYQSMVIKDGITPAEVVEFIDESFKLNGRSQGLAGW